MSEEALIIFQKNLQLGKVKTRLAKHLGKKMALAIFKRLCDHTFRVCDLVAQKKIVYYSDFIPEKPQSSIPNSELRLQSGEHLGQRMNIAIEEVIAAGYQKVVLIGTDCPEITSDILEESFHALDQKDVVLGPAEDGGYYLIGMTRPLGELFNNIPWGSDQVLIKTLEVLKANGISYFLLPTLSDLDTIEDWERFKHLFDFPFD